MKQLRLITTHYLSANTLALLCGVMLSVVGSARVYAQEPTASNTQTAASANVMREYKGVKLGMTRAEVRASMGKAELKEKAKDRFIIKGDDRLTVYYNDDQVKAIHLYFIDAKNAPAWTDVVGDAQVEQMENGAKRARRDLIEEKFWVSMYQGKDGAFTTITISR
jgi:hypothetical protein